MSLHHRDAERAEPGVRRDRRREAEHQYAWIRAGGAWRAGVVLAWFRDDSRWCCWVQHDHPEGRPWPMFEMYVYDPETIIPRDPWDARAPSLAATVKVRFVDLDQRRQFVPCILDQTWPLRYHTLSHELAQPGPGSCPEGSPRHDHRRPAHRHVRQSP